MLTAARLPISDEGFQVVRSSCRASPAGPGGNSAHLARGLPGIERRDAWPRPNWKRGGRGGGRVPSPHSKTCSWLAREKFSVREYKDHFSTNMNLKSMFVISDTLAQIHYAREHNEIFAIDMKIQAVLHSHAIEVSHAACKYFSMSFLTNPRSHS